MNKKGFTLIEMLGVIAILGIIGLIAIPTITTIINQNTDTLDENQKSLIISAAKSYHTDNIYKFTSYPQTVTVKTLKGNGYLENVDIKSNKTEKDLKCSIVTISKSGSKFTYTFTEKNETTC